MEHHSWKPRYNRVLDISYPLWFIIYKIPNEICTWVCCALSCCPVLQFIGGFMWFIYPHSSGVSYWPSGNRAINYYDCLCASEVTVKAIICTGNIDSYHTITKRNGVRTAWYIKCGVVIGLSCFSKILTIDTPQLAREGERWGDFCELKLWSTS